MVTYGYLRKCADKEMNKMNKAEYDREAHRLELDIDRFAEEYQLASRKLGDEVRKAFNLRRAGWEDE